MLYFSKVIILLHRSVSCLFPFFLFFFFQLRYSVSTFSPLITGNFSLNHMPRWSLVPENPSTLLNGSMHLLQNCYNLGMISLPHSFIIFFPSDRIQINLAITALPKPIIPEVIRGQNRRLTVICCQNQNY